MREVAIAGWGSISSLGCTHEQVRAAYERGESHQASLQLGETALPVFSVSRKSRESLAEIEKDARYSRLDPVVHLALHAAREANSPIEGRMGVSIGSSRGATHELEKHFEAFLRGGEKRTSPLASPVTTAGNVSSWVAQDLGLSGLEISTSMTCTSALHSVANALAWLRAGFVDAMLAGGAEAPLTPFTLAQMHALRIYSGDSCRPLAQGAQKNSFVLGEGAAVFRFEAKESGENPELPRVVSVGFGFEPIDSPTGMSEEGTAFSQAMRMALEGVGEVDAVVLHAPGTLQGDAAELSAIHSVFGESQPALFTTKHLTGHTFGASGALSLEFALLLLNGLNPAPLPYASFQRMPRNLIKRVLVNTAGFGGNAVSMVVGF